MWTVEAEGRRLWLRPNSTYIIGRSSSNNVDIPITATSVSRQHLRLKIGAVLPGSSVHPSVRTSVTVTDLGSRYGSSMDFEKLTKDVPQKVPSRKEPVIFKMGPSARVKLEWVPLTVTYSTGATREDEHKTLWDYAVEKLEPLEAKLVPDFFEQTTVYMKTGRGTSKLCYALATALPVVNTQYITALEAMPRISEGPPDPAPYCPDPDLYTPNPERSHCLDQQKFQFIDPQQFEAMGLVIKAAGGDAAFDSEKAVANTLVISPPASKQIPFAASVITVDDIVTAITGCRNVDTACVKKSEPSVSNTASRPLKRKRRDMLEFLTAAEDPTPVQSPVVSTIASPVESTEPSPTVPLEDSEPVPVAKVAKNAPKATPRVSKSLSPEPATNPRKRITTTNLPAPAAKRVKRTKTKELDDHIHVEPEHEVAESDGELDLSNLEELALVDYTVDVQPQPSVPETVSEQSTEQHNYKAFRRRPRVAPSGEAQTLFMPSPETDLLDLPAASTAVATTVSALAPLPAESTFRAESDITRAESTFHEGTLPPVGSTLMELPGRRVDSTLIIPPTPPRGRPVVDNEEEVDEFSFNI